SDQERALAIAGRYATLDKADATSPRHLSAAAERGEQVFKANCASCHSLDSANSAVGPSLKGVIGRRVGSTDFAYSAALAGKSDVWTSRRIVDFAVNPDRVYAGAAMSPAPLAPNLQVDLQSYLEACGR